MTTREQAENIWKRFVELGDGFFVVQREFQNPFHDGRCRYGIGRYTMIPAGTRFEVLTRTYTLKIKGEKVLMTERIVKFENDIVLSGPKGAYFPSEGKIDKSSNKNLTLLELILACTEKDNRSTLGHVVRVESAAKDVPGRLAFVGLLLDTGKVDLNDVRGAIQAWDAMDEEAADELYARHGIE